MKKSSGADRQPKPMGQEPQPVGKGKPANGGSDGSRENKGYKENRDHTTGAKQGDTSKVARKPKE